MSERTPMTRMFSALFAKWNAWPVGSASVNASVVTRVKLTAVGHGVLQIAELLLGGFHCEVRRHALGHQFVGARVQVKPKLLCHVIANLSCRGSRESEEPRFELILRHCS